MDDAIAAIKKRFSFDEWFNFNGLAEGLFVKNYFFSPLLMAGWTPHRTLAAERSGGAIAVQSIWRGRSGDPEELLRLDFFECPSRGQAHENVPQILRQFQAPDVERLAEGTVGDVAFARDPEASVVFARANLVFLVSRAGRRAVDAAAIGRRLDEHLTARPEAGLLPTTAAAAAPPPRIRVSVGVPAAGPAVAAAAGEAATGARDRPWRVAPGVAAPLHVDVQDEGEEPSLLRFFVSDGEVRREKEQLVFVPSEAKVARLTVVAEHREGAVYQDVSWLEVQ